MVAFACLTTGCAAIVGADFDVTARPKTTSTGAAGAPGDSEAPRTIEATSSVLAPNGEIRFFGLSVAIDGDTALIGASDRDWIGRVFVMKRESGVWHIDSDLDAGNYARTNAQFGSSVALSGSWAIVGAKGIDYKSDPGTAYILERKSGTWSLVPNEFTAPTPVHDDQYGTRVAIENDVAVVSAPGNVLGDAGPGAVHVYTRASDGTWSWRQTLGPPNGAPGDQYGYELALRGTTLAIGAHLDDEAGTDAGAVYVYEKTGAEWPAEPTRKLLPAASNADGYRFGEGTLGLESGLLIVPVPGAPSGEQVSAYELDPSGEWVADEFNPAPELEARSVRGWRAAVHGTKAVVVGTGAYGEAAKGFLYERGGGVWSFGGNLISGSPSKDPFGWTIAYDGTTACFGAIFYGDNGGATYFFDLAP